MSTTLVMIKAIARFIGLGKSSDPAHITSRTAAADATPIRATTANGAVTRSAWSNARGASTPSRSSTSASSAFVSRVVGQLGPTCAASARLRSLIERLDVANRPWRFHVNVRATVAIVAVARLVKRLARLRLVLGVTPTVGAQLGEPMRKEAARAVRTGGLLTVVQAQFRLVASLLVVSVVEHWGWWGRRREMITPLSLWSLLGRNSRVR